MDILKRDNDALVSRNVNACDAGQNRHSYCQPAAPAACSRSISCREINANTTPAPAFGAGIVDELSPTGCRVFTESAANRQPPQRFFDAERLIFCRFGWPRRPVLRGAPRSPDSPSFSAFRPVNEPRRAVFRSIFWVAFRPLACGWGRLLRVEPFFWRATFAGFSGGLLDPLR